MRLWVSANNGTRILLSNRSTAPTMSNTSAFRIPDLLSVCHFPSSMNPDYAKAADESIAWISGRDGLGTDDMEANARWIKYFAHTDGALLAAYVYQYAPYEKFRLCCDLVNILFGIDEITDAQSGKDARESMNHHVRILRGEPSDGSPVGRMTAS